MTGLISKELFLQQIEAMERAAVTLQNQSNMNIGGANALRSLLPLFDANVPITADQVEAVKKAFEDQEAAKTAANPGAPKPGKRVKKEAVPLGIRGIKAVTGKTKAVKKGKGGLGRAA